MKHEVFRNSPKQRQTSAAGRIPRRSDPLPVRSVLHGTDPPWRRGDGVEVIADGGTAWIDLTGFQRDLVKCIRQLDVREDLPTGRTIKREAETLYGEEINHGRLYQNLNHLVEYGFVDKMVVDGRTNAYYLTDEAKKTLDEAVLDLLTTCNLSPSTIQS